MLELHSLCRAWARNLSVFDYSRQESRISTSECSHSESYVSACIISSDCAAKDLRHLSLEAVDEPNTRKRKASDSSF